MGRGRTDAGRAGAWGRPRELGQSRDLEPEYWEGRREGRLYLGVRVGPELGGGAKSVLEGLEREAESKEWVWPNCWCGSSASSVGRDKDPRAGYAKLHSPPSRAAASGRVVCGDTPAKVPEGRWPPGRPGLVH